MLTARPAPSCSLVCAVLLPVVAVVACTAQPGVTYHDDVAPLFATHCNSCHQQGGIAPFTLTSYDDVVAQKAAIAFSVANRQMPPWTLDNTGACQTFSDARWMSDDEIKLVVAWIDDGAVEGTVPAKAPTPAAPDRLVEGVGVTRVTMAEPYTPEPSLEYPSDDYRCFFLDPGLVDDAFLTGFEIVAGQPSEVHHMLLFSLLTDDAEAAAAALDDTHAGPGWTCFGAAGEGVDEGQIALVAGWAPGSNVVRYPKDTGLPLPAGRKLVMQIHYNLLAGALPDTTSLLLQHKPSVGFEAIMLPIADTGFSLPPGDEAATFSFSTPLLGLPEVLTVHGIFPHMHTMGRTLHVSKKPIGDTDGSDATCMGDVQEWDFHWQQLAFYERPLTVDGGEQIDVTCTWDTTGRTTPTTWGEGTQDEMCLVFAYLTRESGRPFSELF